MTGIPVADQLDVELAAQRCHADAERDLHRDLAARSEQFLAAPFQRHRAEDARAAGVLLRVRIVEKPDRAGVAGIVVERRVAVARTDHEIADILQAADGLVAIEQAKDLALHQAAGRTEGNQRLVDDVETEGADIEIDDVADLADAVDLCGPALDVVDADQSGIEIGHHTRAGPAGIDLAEGALAELQRVADPETAVGVLEAGKDLTSGRADHVTVGQRKHRLAVGDEAADRATVDLALDRGLNRKAAADQVALEHRRVDGAGAFLVRIDLDHAGGHDATIRQIQERRHQLILLLRMVLQLRALHPVADKDQNAGPRPVLDRRIEQRARSERLRFGVGLSFRRIAIVVADQIAANCGGVDRLQVGEMHVIRLAGIEQVLHRQ
ncbi:hypothetical protein HU675_0018795 [Bradyrhizobium septentrionale]|uniref:hypothetical protein n=1 Tax=Bradyrhizobium septentrionale TaxID=1404411 RepID=UPI001596B482|nr:hypothetical protein [Bradyrhizobium septentrionale]UGY28649.1 hypothetical protein HU675_0018795 [Bradyrhizobium septentrionale]